MHIAYKSVTVKRKRENVKECQARFKHTEQEQSERMHEQETACWHCGVYVEKHMEMQRYTSSFGAPQHQKQRGNRRNKEKEKQNNVEKEMANEMTVTNEMKNA